MSATNAPYLFPSICDGQTTKGNSTSAKLNKWMKARIKGEGKVVHSFRHSMRDRLRAVECPPDIIDQLGGWTTGGVGQGYGSGYPMEVLAKWLGRTA
jgi:integrase